MHLAATITTEVRLSLLACLVCLPLAGSSAASAFPVAPRSCAQASAVRQSPPDRARVEAVLRDVERAFESGDASARIAALQSAASVVDAAVVTAVSRGLRDRDASVCKAAIEALRWMEHPSAVKALQNAARKDSSFKDDAVLFAALLRAIGQHADPSSLAILTDDVWSVRDHAVIQARILGLGWIRTRESAEALMDFMKLGGSRKVDPFMTELRVALLRVTGVDQGASCELWLAWWNDHKSRLRIPTETPTLPKGLDARWREYWQLRPNGAAREPRACGEHGKDGSTDKGGGGSR